ncbi:hypothetical protein G9A89_002933 [Geosiphon pyriformis]|nr:hypothetical protein G9A89_002933 [Geosiphon pyriformis]
MPSLLNSLVIAFLSFSSIDLVSSQAPGTRFSHCLFTYNDTLYMFGGTVDWGAQAATNYFHSAQLPFSTLSTPWKPENINNAVPLQDPACVVEPSLGYALVIGGGNELKLQNPGIQIYNFKTKEWNESELKNTYFPTFPSELTKSIYRPAAVLLAPKLVFMYLGGFSETDRVPGSYLLDLGHTPWKWTAISRNSTQIIMTSPGLASSKGNAFIFGGFYHLNNSWPPSNDSYIYSQIYGYLPTPYTIPTTIADAVVGVLNDKLMVIVLETGSKIENQQMFVLPLDLSTMKLGIQTIPTGVPANTNNTLMRNRAGYVQLPGSDTIVIYGGVTSWPMGKTSSSMIAYNMTTGAWTTNVNIVKNIPSDQYQLAKVNGLDLENGSISGTTKSYDDPKSSNLSKDPTDTKKKDNLPTSTIIGILIGVIGGLGLLGGISAYIFFSLKKKRLPAEKMESMHVNNEVFTGL